MKYIYKPDNCIYILTEYLQLDEIFSIFKTTSYM